MYPRSLSPLAAVATLAITAQGAAIAPLEVAPRVVWAIAQAGVTLINLIAAGSNFLEDPPQPWDPASGNCVIEVRTTNGGNCVAGASPPGEPAFTDLDDWSQCFLNGEQYLTFPDAPGRPSVGDVMVKFTKAGGVTPNAGDGLYAAEISLLSLNPPVMIDTLDEYGKGFGRICTHGDADGGRTRWEKCGVPCRDAVGDFTKDN